MMSGNDIDRMFREHGGVIEVHTEPVFRDGVVAGWVNTCVLADGYRYRMAVEEEGEYLRVVSRSR